MATTKVRRVRVGTQRLDGEIDTTPTTRGDLRRRASASSLES
jgi:hypothetical protein